MKANWVRCASCEEVMPRSEWEEHRCPWHVDPKPGETFEAYSERFEESRRAYLARKTVN